ncbi:MAG: hypothetical protein KJ000_36145 [Pirellulaceae bacterium]|nr:hypothetical protein [Pirellulaceae bacterium]
MQPQGVVSWFLFLAIAGGRRSATLSFHPTRILRPQFDVTCGRKPDDLVGQPIRLADLTYDATVGVPTQVGDLSQEDVTSCVAERQSGLLF